MDGISQITGIPTNAVFKPNLVQVYPLSTSFNTSQMQNLLLPYAGRLFALSRGIVMSWEKADIQALFRFYAREGLVSSDNLFLDAVEFKNIAIQTLMEHARLKQDILEQNSSIFNIERRLRHPGIDDIEILSLMDSQRTQSVAHMTAREGRLDNCEPPFSILALKGTLTQTSVAQILAERGETFSYLPPEVRQLVWTMRDSSGCTVAHVAARNGYDFVQENPLILAVDDHRGWTVAHELARLGKKVPDFCYMWEMQDGVTVAHTAVQAYGIDSFPETLLYMEDSQGWTVAHEAAFRDRGDNLPVQTLRLVSRQGDTVAGLLIESASRRVQIDLPGHLGNVHGLDFNRLYSSNLPPEILRWRDMPALLRYAAFCWHKLHGGKQTFEEFQTNQTGEELFDLAGRLFSTKTAV